MQIRSLIFSLFLLGFYLPSQAQNYFYKQFKGKIGEREIRAELIYAPSKGNPQFNLRGSYVFTRQGEEVELTNGSLDDLGNVYLEAGIKKLDFSGQKTFVRTGIFQGTYYANIQRLEGEWFSVNSRQSAAFFLQEDYSNSSIPADIVFNDLSYEDAEIRFHYPRFTTKASANELNEFVQNNILGDMQAKMSKFISLYKESAQLGGMLEGFESSQLSFIRHNEENLLCIEHQSNENTGGAHGVYQSLFYNFNIANGQVLTLGDLLVNNYQEDLQKIAEERFRRQLGMAADQSLNDYGFSFPNNTFKLNNNFYLNSKGIGFYYNVYEIAPYAVGPQDLFIPYASLSKLIKKNGLLSPYIK